MISLKINNQIIPTKLWNFPVGEAAARLDGSFITAFPADNSSIIVEILWYYENDSEFFQVAQLASLFNPYRKFVLLYLSMPYIPYARQDRSTEAGDPNALKVFAKLLNSLGWDTVCVSDPHSDASEIIDNLVVADQALHVKQVMQTYQVKPYDYIVAPDAGALKKIYKVADTIGVSRDNVLVGFKIRDTETGSLKYQAVRKADGSSLDSLEGKRVLVADDLADGSFTFTQVALLLENFVPATMDLFVTHGRFTKGHEVVTDVYDNVLTGYTKRENINSVKSLVYID